MRLVLGVVIGAILGVAVVYGLEYVNHALFPWPAMDAADPVSVAAAIDAAPMTAKVMLVGGWFLGALAGGLVAVRVGRHFAAGWIVALLVAAGAVATTILIPHPLWLQIAAGVAPLIAGLVVQGASGAA